MKPTVGLLSDFELSSYKHRQEDFLLPDTPSTCLNRKHFKTYPHKVNYTFNSRGYRDNEWPDSAKELTEAFWCIGDSSVMGVGAPISHSWPVVLSEMTNKRCINISMLGASNEWIARQVNKLLDQLEVDTVVICWSYVHRREQALQHALEDLWETFYASVKDATWPVVGFKEFDTLPDNIKLEIKQQHDFVGFRVESHLMDEHRILGGVCVDEELNLILTLKLIQEIELRKGNTKILHTFVPNFINKEYHSKFAQMFERITSQSVLEIKKIDFARDYHHFDIKTSRQFAKQIVGRL